MSLPYKTYIPKPRKFYIKWNERHLIAYFGTLMTLKLIVSIESRVSL